MKKYWIATLSVCSLAFCLGCGGADPKAPKLYTVSGTVTFDGEPLDEADMVIRTADGKYAAGSRVEDGKFTAKLATGPSIVEITAMKDSPDGKYREENPGERVPVKVQIIPKKYNSQSTLKIDIQPDTKDVKFDLTTT